MRVLCYTWAGVRSTDLESTVRFFAETLGLSLIEQHEGLAGSVRLMVRDSCSRSSDRKAAVINFTPAQFWDFTRL